ncbi:CRTAC1 family protein [Emticicia sp. 17c]|uniref:CRTAC1 family protein n=1 Tax=Emticicia sp. 17c TaxID=3127704 RepID=UPI00301D272D
MKLIYITTLRLKYWVILISFSALFSCKNATEKETEMVKILKNIHKENFKKENPFCPEAELAFFDSMLAISKDDPRRHFIAEYYKANALLKVGQEVKAVNMLEKLAAKAVTDFQGNIYMTMNSLGMANLRLAERQNCVNNHTAESCIMPIANSGVHTQKMGSRRAIEVYKSILRRLPEDYEAQWLLNVAYMTIGEYPAKVPAEYLIPNLDKDLSGYAVKPFTDVAPNLKLNIHNKAGGVIVEDFNNDGYLDIVTSDWGLDGSMHYFKNNADNTFTDVSEKAGLSKCKGGLNIMQADYNNDGFTDIFVLRGAWMADPYGKQPNSLLKNNGNGTFTDVTIESGLFSLHPTQAGVWSDFNNDGWLDIFIGNETKGMSEPHNCELYINNQNGTFRNIALEAGCNINTFIKGVTAADYDNDGWQDIFLSTLNGPKILLKNKGMQNGKLMFQDVTMKAGLGSMINSTFPTWFWDYDNDGWKDIFICGYQFERSLTYSVATDVLGIPNMASKMYLFRNNHDGTFKNVSEEMGLNHSVFAMGANFGDIDNDGYLDMYLGTGNPDYQSLVPNKLYKNINGQKFADVTVSARVGNLQKGHGVGISDIDNDGDQDIFIEVGGAYQGDAYNNSLYLNPGQNNNNWIKLKLEGKKANRSAIGAKIKISFHENNTSRVIYRDVNSGGSFGSSSLRAEIGIGQATIIDEIMITWPGSNKKQVFRNIRPRQFLKITEGNENLEEINLKTLNFEGTNKNIPICVTPTPKTI